MSAIVMMQRVTTLEKEVAELKARLSLAESEAKRLSDFFRERETLHLPKKEKCPIPRSS